MYVSVSFILFKTELKTTKNKLGHIKVISEWKGFINGVKALIFKPFGYLFVTLATDKPIENGFTTS